MCGKMWSTFVVALVFDLLICVYTDDGSSSGMASTSVNDLMRQYFNYYQRYNLSGLLQRIQALEYNIKTGAIGGCESGVVGPFSPTQRRGRIRFTTKFATPPAVSLALSDIKVQNGTSQLDFQIRPISVNRTTATVSLTDKTKRLTSAYVSFMACPNNGNKVVRPQMFG